MTPEQLLGRVFRQHLARRRLEELIDGFRVVDGPWHFPGQSTVYVQDEQGQRLKVRIEEA